VLLSFLGHSYALKMETVLLKRWYTSIRLHGGTSQNTVIFIRTSLRLCCELRLLKKSVKRYATVSVIFQNTNTTSVFALPLVASGDGDDTDIMILDYAENVPIFLLS
jgi:hypothetical protein